MTRPSTALVGALIAVATASSACSSSSHPNTLPPLAKSPTAAPVSTSGGPRWYAVMQHGVLQWYDSRTAEPLGTRGGPSGDTITAIASWHDGDSVVYAAKPVRSAACQSVVGRQIVSASGLDETAIPHLVSLPGAVDRIAVSPDRSNVAVALRAGDHCDRTELVVVNLHSGARRTWTLPYAESKGNAGYSSSYFIDLVSWGPDNRRLLVHYGQCCAIPGGVHVLDTQSTPGPLLSRFPPIPSDQPCLLSMPYAWEAHGVVIDSAATACTGTAAALAFVDPATGDAQPLGRLPFDDSIVDEVAPDATGDHLLVDAGRVIYRVDGTAVQRLSTLADAPRQIAW